MAETPTPSDNWSREGRRRGTSKKERGSKRTPFSRMIWVRWWTWWKIGSQAGREMGATFAGRATAGLMGGNG